LDRLTEADYLVGLLTEDEVFGMDDLGNRTTVNLRSGVDQVYTTATPNLTNRYMEIDSEPLDYDEAGNLTRDHDGYYHVYDYENRVTRIYKMDGQMETDVAHYRYDALGRRIAKYDSIAAEMTLYYHNDEWQVLAEYDYTGFLRSYIYGNYIDEPLIMNDGTNDYYYAHDHQYSTVALANTLGQVVERYEYDAYGRTQILSPGFSVLASSQYGNPYAFTGRQLDILDGTNLRYMHYRHRDYNPTLGRFMTHDPLGVSIRMMFREFPWFVGTTGPTIRNSEHGRLLETYLTIAQSKNLGFFLQGIGIYKKGSHFEYPQYANGMSLYQLTMSQPLIYTDPYGLAANSIDDAIGPIMDWDPSHDYSENECYAYCYWQALGLSDEALGALGEEAVKQSIKNILEDVLNGPLSLCETAANAGDLGACNSICTAFAETGQPFEDPWGSAHGGLIIIVGCLLLVGLFKYLRDKNEKYNALP
jgi:RHS repeat-associated protein